MGAVAANGAPVVPTAATIQKAGEPCLTLSGSSLASKFPETHFKSACMLTQHYGIERNRRISCMTRALWSVWKRNWACAEPSRMISSLGPGTFSY